MPGRVGEGEAVRVPPAPGSVIGIAAIPHQQQRAAAAHPGSQGFMLQGTAGLHPLIAENEGGKTGQAGRIPQDVFQLDRAQGDAGLDQRHGQTEEMGEGTGGDIVIVERGVRGNLVHQGLRGGAGILTGALTGQEGEQTGIEPLRTLRRVGDAVREGALIQAAVGHEHPDGRQGGIKALTGLIHIPQGAEKGADELRVGRGNGPGFLHGFTGDQAAVGQERGLWIDAAEHPGGPGTDLIAGNGGMEQGSDDGPEIIVPEGSPGIGRVVLHGIMEKPHAAACGADQLLHDAVFQEGGFEGTLGIDPAVYIAAAGGAGPDLGDAAVHIRDIQQGAFRGKNLPLGIIDEGMGGHIEGQVPAEALRIGLQARADLRNEPAEEQHLQGGSPMAAFHTLMRGTPGLPVFLLPGALESGAVAGGVPVFRFLQMHGLHPGVHGRLQPGKQIAGEGGGGAEIGGIRAVQDGLAVPAELTLIPMGSAVPGTGKIIPIIPPGTAGHQMHHISPVTEGADPGGHRIIHAIDHDKVHAQIRTGGPGGTFLDSGEAFAVIVYKAHKKLLAWVKRGKRCNSAYCIMNRG